jgi:hypothetical protein
MTAYLSPVLQEAQFNGDATFLVGGLIWFYAAGTSTPLLAYQDEAGTVPWPNPIQLNSRGETGGTIWLGSYADTGGYKIVLENTPFYGQTHGVVINNFDNITGVNDPNSSTTSSDWISYAGSPSYLSSDLFSVSGDQTSIFQQHRRVKTINNAGVMTGSVINSSYASGVTNVYLSNDTGNVLDSGLSQVYYGFIQTTSPQIRYGDTIIVYSIFSITTNEIVRSSKENIQYARLVLTEKFIPQISSGNCSVLQCLSLSSKKRQASRN